MVVVVREPNPWTPLAEGLGQGIQTAAQMVAQRASQNRLASELVSTGQFTPAQASAITQSSPEMANALMKRFQSMANMSKYNEILSQLNPQVAQQPQQQIAPQEPQNLYGFTDYLNKLQAQGVQGAPVTPIDRMQQQQAPIPQQQPQLMQTPESRYKQEADIYGKAAQAAFASGDPAAMKYFSDQQKRALDESYREQKLTQMQQDKTEERSWKEQKNLRNELVKERTDHQKVTQSAESLLTSIGEVERLAQENPDYIGTAKSLLVGAGLWGTAADINKSIETLVRDASSGMTGMSRGTKAFLQLARDSKISPKMTMPEFMRALKIMRFAAENSIAYGNDIDTLLSEQAIPKGWAKQLNEQAKQRSSVFTQEIGSIKRQLTDTDIDRFLSQANGDIDKAEELARQAGYEV